MKVSRLAQIFNQHPLPAELFRTFMKNALETTRNYLRDTGITHMPPILVGVAVHGNEFPPAAHAFVLPIHASRPSEMGAHFYDLGYKMASENAVPLVAVLLGTATCSFVMVPPEKPDAARNEPTVTEERETITFVALAYSGDLSAAMAYDIARDAQGHLQLGQEVFSTLAKDAAENPASCAFVGAFFAGVEAFCVEEAGLLPMDDTLRTMLRNVVNITVSNRPDAIVEGTQPPSTTEQTAPPASPDKPGDSAGPQVPFKIDLPDSGRLM